MLRGFETAYQETIREMEVQNYLRQAHAWYMARLLPCPYRHPRWRPGQQILTSYTGAESEHGEL